MSMRDEDFGAALAPPAEADDGFWSPPMAAPAFEPRDWPSLYEEAHARAERERARADAAQARAEELRRAEVDARSRAGSLKSQLDAGDGGHARAAAQADRSASGGDRAGEGHH